MLKNIDLTARMSCHVKYIGEIRGDHSTAFTSYLPTTDGCTTSLYHCRIWVEEKAQREDHHQEREADHLLADVDRDPETDTIEIETDIAEVGHAIVTEKGNDLDLALHAEETIEIGEHYTW